MERQKITSTGIRSVGYERGRQLLEIEYAGGGVYDYYGVPASIYHGLMNAPSRGRYVNQHIKPRFPYRRRST